MLLKSVTVSGYRSFRYKDTLHVEPRVTIVVGANDHGKSNLLRAIQHLNTNESFTDSDLSWDCDKVSTTEPTVQYVFELSQEERKHLLTIENAARNHPDHESTEVSQESTGPNESSSIDTNEYPKLKLKDIPDTVTLCRSGSTGKLTPLDFEEFEGDATTELLDNMLPKVLTVKPISSILDSITANEIMSDESEFMRGIFYYAGLDPNDSSIFEQSDRNQMRLNKASSKLNDELKRSWTQGKELTFVLVHNSANSSIELKLDDPNVQDRYVRPSRRSSGFTHYFALKTIENPGRQHIFLFDEPGIYLHPSGQRDLLKVLDTISLESQSIYTTHSLFMLSKTHPTRHRLITKEGGTSKINGKPCSGRWGSITSALGLNITGSILFANYILITEGDSDPIYIQAMMQKLIETGHCKRDINNFTVISSGDSRNADAMIRILYESDPKPNIAVLLDGDEGGKERDKQLKTLAKKLDISVKLLSESETIEDSLIAGSKLYVSAAAKYAAKIISLQNDTDPTKDYMKEFSDSYDKYVARGTSRMWKWTVEAFESIAGLDKPSKIGIAREYILLLEDVTKDSLDGSEVSKFKKLANWISTELDLPIQDSGKRDMILH